MNPSPIWPWQRAIRTGLAVVVSALITTASVLGLLAATAPQLLDAVKTFIRPEDYALLVSWVAGITTVAVFLSRLMAIPAVDQFLHKFGAGSAPKSAIANPATGTSPAAPVSAETPQQPANAAPSAQQTIDPAPPR